jgi:hypothetical protein
MIPVEGQYAHYATTWAFDKNRAQRVESRSAVSGSQWASQRVPEPQAVNINPAGAHAVGIPAAVPTMSAMAEPNVAVVRFTHDVMLVGGSIFVLVRASISVAAIMMTSTVAAFSVMAAAVVPTTVMPASLTSAFRVRGFHYSKAERRSDRKDETNLLQHFCFSSWDKETTYSPKRFVNAL